MKKLKSNIKSDYMLLTKSSANKGGFQLNNGCWITAFNESCLNCFLKQKKLKFIKKLKNRTDDQFTFWFPQI